MAILFGIDGTGPYSGSKYTKEFKRSFVNQMCDDKNYFWGPTNDGSLLTDGIDKGYNYIKTKIAQGDKSPILLTGYSRGALGAIVIAKKLQKKSIKVSALLMFDCVDRHLWYDGEYIPNNVENVFHIRRHINAKSRVSFGNDGTKYRSPTKYTEKFFMGTHGAMGGTYWKPKTEKGEKWTDLVDEGTEEAVANTTLLRLVNPMYGPYYPSVKNYKTNVTFAQDRAASNAIVNDKDVQNFIKTFGFPSISYP